MSLKLRAYDRDHFVTDWKGEKWHLRATPSGTRHPWELTCGALMQEIGAPTSEAARDTAELWLALTDLIPSPEKLHKTRSSESSAPKNDS